MSLIEYTMFGTVDKVKQAISRLRAFDPLQYSDKPYHVAYSGGKDSDVIRILCTLANVRFDLVHNHTTVDAPETVRYVNSIPDIIIEYPELSMWRLIEKKKLPPTRRMRYCCSYLKERGGEGRVIVTGVRWDESKKREQLRSEIEILSSDAKSKLILKSDNDMDRRLFENCQLRGKRVVNPIIDWLENDVWEFLNYYGCKSNPLYSCGFKRIGCVGCPLSSNQKNELERYPVYKLNYIKAFERMLCNYDGKDIEWKTGEDVLKWWISNKKLPKQIDGQLELDMSL